MSTNIGIPAKFLSDRDRTLAAARKARAEIDTLISSLEFHQPVTNKPETLSSLLNLKHELDGPFQTYVDVVTSVMDFGAIMAMAKLRIFEAIGPSEEGTKIDEIVAQVAPVDREYVERLLKAVETTLLVEEYKEGTWRLKGAGVLFVEKEFKGAGLLTIAEWGHAATYIAKFIDKYPSPHDTRENPWTMVENQTVWDYFAANPDMARLFSSAMLSFNLGDYSGPVIAHILNDTNRATLSGHFIDVGGGSGHICRYLAPQFPSWTFEVQDLDENQFLGAQSELCEDLANRIMFKQQSFFSPFTIPEKLDGPLIFFMAHVLHDWHDADAARIIANLVPVLEKWPRKASIMLGDIMLREFGEVDPVEESIARRYDMTMLTYNGAKERSLKNWRGLFKGVDGRFEERVVRRHGAGEEGRGSAMAVLEFVLEV